MKKKCEIKKKKKRKKKMYNTIQSKKRGRNIKLNICNLRKYQILNEMFKGEKYKKRLLI